MCLRALISNREGKILSLLIYPICFMSKHQLRNFSNNRRSPDDHEKTQRLFSLANASVIIMSLSKSHFHKRRERERLIYNNITFLISQIYRARFSIEESYRETFLQNSESLESFARFYFLCLSSLLAKLKIKHTHRECIITVVVRRKKESAADICQRNKLDRLLKTRPSFLSIYEAHPNKSSRVESSPVQFN